MAVIVQTLTVLWMLVSYTTALDNATILETYPTGGQCLRVYDEDCSWCVQLFRSRGKVTLGQCTDSGMFCSGALVGRRVVLTSATCALRNETVTVRVPSSADPAKGYVVADMIRHPDYYSGTHSNDFALMVLQEDVQFEYGSINGACIDFLTSPRRKCLAVGFSNEEELVTTPIKIQDQHCRLKKINSNEVACGEADLPEECAAAVGAPVVCSSNKDKQGGLVLMGVIRNHCQNGKVSLGKVRAHRDWLSGQLQKLGVEPVNFNV